MSSRRRNLISKKIEAVDLDVINNFLKITGVMIGALLIITFILFLCSEKTQESNAVYVIIIFANGIFILLSLLLSLTLKVITKK